MPNSPASRGPTRPQIRAAFTVMRTQIEEAIAWEMAQAYLARFSQIQKRCKSQFCANPATTSEDRCLSCQVRYERIGLFS